MHFTDFQVVDHNLNLPWSQLNFNLLYTLSVSVEEELCKFLFSMKLDCL